MDSALNEAQLTQLRLLAENTKDPYSEIPSYGLIRDSERRGSTRSEGHVHVRWWGNGVLRQTMDSDKPGSFYHVDLLTKSAEESLPVPENLRPQPTPPTSWSLILNHTRNACKTSCKRYDDITAQLSHGLFKPGKKEKRGCGEKNNNGTSGQGHGSYSIPSMKESLTVINISNDRPKIKPLAMEIIAAIAVSLASMVIGIASAYSSPAIPSMHEGDSTLYIELDGDEASWIGSLMPLGALLGGLVGGFPVEQLGRRRTVMATAIPFIFSWLLIALANHIWMIYLARVIAGVCTGIVGLTLPVYLAETVQPRVRGILGLFPTTFGNLGILIAYVAGKYVNWRNLAFIGAGLSVPYLVCMQLIPETPRWYISKGKDDEAEKSLQWFRGEGSDIRNELNLIKTSNAIAMKTNMTFKDLFCPVYMKIAFIALGLMFFQQFSGINAVIFYSTTIFLKAGSTIDESLSTIIVGLVNMGAIFISILLIDRLGRKVLLLVSDILMIISLLALATFFYTDENHPELIEGYGWIPLLSVVSFVLAFSLGFGSIPWLMMGEIFPSRIRGPAAALSTAFNWTCTFAVTKMFPQIVSSFGIHTAFFGFAGICIVGIFFIIFVVPETRGKSLEDIEKNLSGGKERKLSATAHLKPLPSVIAG